MPIKGQNGGKMKKNDHFARGRGPLPPASTSLVQTMRVLRCHVSTEGGLEDGDSLTNSNQQVMLKKAKVLNPRAIQRF